MCALGINSDIRSVYNASLSLIFVFISFSLKTLSFSRRSPNLSQKNDDLGLIHRWIVVKFKHRFTTQFWGFPLLGITRKCRSWEKYHSNCNFSFPAETQSCLGKNTILNLLTVGLSWNVDMLLETQFRTSSPLGFRK